MGRDLVVRERIGRLGNGWDFRINGMSRGREGGVGKAISGPLSLR